jgi:hypothetical protein
MTTTGVIHSRVTLSANTTDSVTEERILALVRPLGLVGWRIGAAPVHWSTCRDYHCNCSSES